MPDPKAAAKLAKLRYVNDTKPGIARTRHTGKEGETWRFFKPDGAEITDEAEIARIKKLAIPPAYTDVWICPHPNGHLQAVGRDARGRKQYRYHARWRLVRDEAKYARMLVFGAALPIIRDRVRKDLAREGLPKPKVIAAIVALLEKTVMRVGNEEYARQNGSFGLTTLRSRHVKVRAGHVVFDFKGKHGIKQHIDLGDRRLANLVAKCQDLPGQDLFQYHNDAGDLHHVTSDDVNDYLQEATGEDITAKDFRTWAATNLAVTVLAEFERFDNATTAKKNVVQAVELVAKQLGNTPAICRKCYIHPAVFEGYLDGSLLESLKTRAGEMLHSPATGLTAKEAAITAYLSRRLGEAIDHPKKPIS